MDPISDAQKAKIRYVGGMCVAKSSESLHEITIFQITAFLNTYAKVKVKAVQNKVDGSTKMIAEYDSRSTSDKTLEEIEIKQHVQKALIYITDAAFVVFF